MRTVVFLLFSIFMVHANASIVTVDYTGYVSQDNPIFSENTAVSGQIIYETRDLSEDLDPTSNVATFNDILVGFSIFFSEAVGDPAVLIAGALDVASSTATITDNYNGTNTDFYHFSADVTNGPAIYTTQSNGYVRSAVLNSIDIDAGQNSNPISTSALTSTLFDDFAVTSGQQPQRIFLGFGPNPDPQYGSLNASATITFTPTSTTIAEAVPLPATLWLFIAGMTLLVVERRGRYWSPLV